MAATRTLTVAPRYRSAAVRVDLREADRHGRTVMTVACDKFFPVVCLGHPSVDPVLDVSEALDLLPNAKDRDLLMDLAEEVQSAWFRLMFPPVDEEEM